MSDQMHNRPELPNRTHSSLFAQALRNDSNLALDWLWFASQLSDEAERDYCLKRAQYIDPNIVINHYERPELQPENLIQRLLKYRDGSVPDRPSEEQLVTNI